MKITDLTTIPAGKYLFIQVHTDEGITGTGEIGSWGFIDGTVGVLEKFRQYPHRPGPVSDRASLAVHVPQHVF